MATLKINGDTSGYVELVAKDVAGSTSIRLDKIVVANSSGDVGIGTSLPSSKLNLYDPTAAVLEVSAFNNWVGLVAGIENPPQIRWKQGWSLGFGTATHATGADPLNFNGTGYDNKMTISNGGNVGIGTTNPLNKFVVAEANDQHGVEIAPGTLSYIQAYDRATSDYGDLSIDAQSIRFATDNGTERMRIASDGNVGIGETVPVAKLHIQGSGTSGQVSSSLILENSSSGTAGLQITGAAGSSHLDFMYAGGPGTGTNTLTTGLAMTLEGANAGNVGIGTATPGNKLQVNASSAIADELILKLDGSGAGFNGANDANIKHGLVYELCSYSSSTGVVQRQAAKIEVQKVGSWNEAAGGNGTKADLVFSTNNGTIATPAMAERMRVSSEGIVTKPYQPGFEVTLSSLHPTTTGTYTIPFNTNRHNMGSHLNTANGVFTAPVAGFYHFDCQILLNGVSNTDDSLHVHFAQNDTHKSYFNLRAPGESANGYVGYGEYLPVIGTVSSYMNANDTMRVKVQAGGGSVGVHNADWCSFSGFLIG